KEGLEVPIMHTDKEKKKQILATDELDNYNKDNTNQLFDKLEYESEELNELERFLSDCVLSNEEKVGLDAILAQVGNDQNEYIVVYTSRSLTKLKHNYSITKQKCLAVI
ncbi:2235_t:CDS:2, partial [Dentiscutata erythropus]